MVGPPFRCLRASALFALVPSFDRRRAFVRLHFVTTGTRPSDSPRVIINIDRASRDLAYFFYHLPVERVAWAFPYAPPGLYTQFPCGLMLVCAPSCSEFATKKGPQGREETKDILTIRRANSKSRLKKDSTVPIMLQHSFTKQME